MSYNDYNDNDFNTYDDKAKNDKVKRGESLTWQQVWMQTITNPATATFERILEDPQADQNRGFRWIFYVGTLVGVLSLIINTIQLSSFGYDMGTLLPMLLCVVILAGPLSLVAFWISSGLLQWIARMFGGYGSYSDFFYASAAYQAPLQLINASLLLFTASTALLLTNIFLSIYSIVLTAMALRAVNGFGWGKALATIFIPGIIVTLAIIGLLSFTMPVSVSTSF